jgi:ABC-type phosphate/phosphonate transport system substrate-binding protein
VIASLPMYDIVELRHAHDALWVGMARHFRHQGIDHVPRKLVHDRPVNSLWSADNLFMSQCCGYDVVYQFKDRFQILATPWFDAPGCSQGNYSSTIVVPTNSLKTDVIDMAGTVAVVNGPESHSGMNALFSLVAPHSRNNRFFSEVKISGSHVESLALLANGQADVAAVDCLTYELLSRYRPAAIRGTRPLGLTCSAPAPPYVTARAFNLDTVERMQNALLETYEDQALAGSRQALLISKIELSSALSYQRILDKFEHNLRAI